MHLCRNNTTTGFPAAAMAATQHSLGAGATDLAVVHAECNAENILGVPHKPAGGVASVEVPQTQSAVPAA